MPIGGGGMSPLSQTSDFYMESFANHQEQLLAMQRQQQEELLKRTDLESSFDLDHSFSSQPTSRFTLDSASARFAASAVCTSTKDLLPTGSDNSMTKPLGEPAIKQEVDISTPRSSLPASASSIASVLGIATSHTPNVSTAQVSSSYGASVPSGGSIQKRPQNNGFASSSTVTTVTNCATSSSTVLGHTSLASALAATPVSSSHASGSSLAAFSLSNGPVIDSKLPSILCICTSRCFLMLEKMCEVYIFEKMIYNCRMIVGGIFQYDVQTWAPLNVS